MRQQILTGVLAAASAVCTCASAQALMAAAETTAAPATPAAPAAPAAKQDKQTDTNEGFKFEPLMFDTKGGTGNVFGVNFQYQKSWVKVAGNDEVLERAAGLPPEARTRGLMSCGGYAEAQGKAIPEWVSFTDCGGQVSAKGTLAADADKNPNKFLDFNGNYSWIYTRSSRTGLDRFSVGGQVKYETDQGFENKQIVFGIKGTFLDFRGCGATTLGVACPNSMNYLALSVGLQRVDPLTDKARKAALAGKPIDEYQRVELEAFYKFYLPKEWQYVSDLEFNYRHFQELSPPDAIRQAGLDRNRLGLVRLNFGFAGKGATSVTPDMFIQYSRGSLPFDTKSERVVKIGLQFKVF